MRLIKPLLFIVLLGASATTPAHDAVPPAVTNYEASGNLQSTKSLGCKLDDIDQSYTPADLYPGVAACIQEGNTVDGIAMTVIAGAYSRYDVLRVLDKTAHDAPSLLRMQAFGPLGKQKMGEFNNQLVAYLQNDNTHAALCRLLLKFGPPTYYPRYMIQHGMDAFVKPKGPKLAPDFDPAANWLEVMHEYLKCDITVKR